MEMHLTGYHNISDENFIFKGLGNSCLDLVQEETLSYTPNGNITDKTDAGEYAYHPTKPNAVTGVSNDNQTISLLTQDITYNAFNKAETIEEENGYELAFLYGHDKQRRKTSFYENGNPMLDKYFVGLYEKEFEPQTGITRHINYIMAGDGMTAIVLQEEESGNTIEETYFTYKDHLGSIIALTDENGDVVLEQSFDAWGRYRNTDNWTYSNVDESPTWLRGYTGHEHLPHFDLINMNGRIYDPILGRMLSPDNFVQDPLFSQSYNRYSYVWNNPLRYNDPSGDAVVAGMIIGAVVGGYIGGALANNTFSINQWEWDGNTAGGIIKGAMFGAFAGAGIGAGLAGEFGTGFQTFLQSGAVKSGLLSGGINAMYNYESGQGFWSTVGYFGSGFVGGAIGAGVNTFIGMGVSGFGNVGVFALSLEEEQRASFREYAQKFVSGALAAYAGTSVFGEVNYIKINDKYLGGYKEWKGLSKAWRAGWLNQASDFAHSSEYAFNSRSLGERVLMFGFAGGSSLIGGALDAKIDDMKKGLGKASAKFGMTFFGGGSDYLFQQTIHYSYSNNPDYRPFHYNFGWKKTSIFSYKSLFYALSQ
jgi:RHS repeat-associated protein